MTLMMLSKYLVFSVAFIATDLFQLQDLSSLMIDHAILSALP